MMEITMKKTCTFLTIALTSLSSLVFAAGLPQEGVMMSTDPSKADAVLAHARAIAASQQQHEHYQEHHPKAHPKVQPHKWYKHSYYERRGHHKTTYQAEPAEAQPTHTTA